MTAEIERLQSQMEAAAEALDFEQARMLRDQINLLRGGASAADALAADTSGLIRQQPGNMGLGTSQPRPTPPPGWRAPRKPDPMTRATGRRRARTEEPE
ncbi:MAG: UvrB/UvrC motif-containing protein [Sphingomonas sp.]